MSTTDCVTVGYSGPYGEYQTLVEQWDGTNWSIVPSPDINPTQQNELTGLSCTSATDCVAVGYASPTSTTTQTLVEQWDGTTWSVVPSSDTSPTQINQLVGVSCASPSACMAVGQYFTGVYDQTLVEQWDGTNWSVVPSSDTSPTQTNDLSGVSCTSTTDCVAVGEYENDPANGIDQTLIEQWDGTIWTIVPSPNDSSHYNALNGVSCTSDTACTAVGWYFPGPPPIPAETLIEQWDGSSWAIVSSNNRGRIRGFLFGVSCFWGMNCTAVGSSDIEDLVIPTKVSHVTPRSGPTAGGTMVTITGTGFSGTTGVAGVTFGSTNVLAYTVVSDTEITATTPPNGAGVVPVTVNAPGGSATLANSFTYKSPTVKHVTPRSGPTAGGTMVTITGTGFSGTTGVAGVTFGSTNVLAYTVVSDTEITATTPPNGAGVVPVTVNAPGGSATLANSFTYKSPTVKHVTPRSGPTAGGTMVTITGTGFSGTTGVAGVTFGSTNVLAYTVVSDTEITATTPPNGAGVVPVTVNAPGGSATLANGYTYVLAH